MYKIINDQPAPSLQFGRQLQKYPIMDLGVGQSFTFSVNERAKISNAAARYKARHKKSGWNYVCRQIDGQTCQLWRVS